jgi:hypothetical protein
VALRKSLDRLEAVFAHGLRPSPSLRGPARSGGCGAGGSLA